MDLQGQWVEILGLREQAWLPFTDKSFAAGFWRGRHQDREVTWGASKFSPAGSLSTLNISLQLFISLYQRIPSCLELPWRGIEAVIAQYNNEYSAPEGTLYSPETLEHSRWKRQQCLFSWLPGNPAMWTHQATACREREKQHVIYQTGTETRAARWSEGQWSIPETDRAMWDCPLVYTLLSVAHVPGALTASLALLSSIWAVYLLSFQALFRIPALLP